MTIQILLLIAGLLLILFGANYLVEGSSSVAKKSGISEFVIGLTIVGIGTSTPEMVVSFMSAIKGNADISIGNIVGSNIFNTMLILGVTALISPLVITKTNLRRDIPMNIIATMLLILLGLNQTIFGIGSNTLSRIDGLILLSLFAYYLYTSFKNDSSEDEVEEEGGEIKLYSGLVSTIMIIGGLAGLIFGGRLFVNSATEIATILGVSDAFIAITVMAGGTSLPELATCIVAAAKKRGQLALGNILGSNISNILLILGGSSLINPLTLKGITPVDFGTMLIGSIFILASAYLFQKKKLDRIEGAILLLMEAGYMTWLIASI
ncbi:MAG: calcium/sodium antiporter [Candidatus Cryptobacteroides sp.]